MYQQNIQIFASTVIMSMVIAILPLSALAEAEAVLYTEPDPYADAIQSSGINLYQPEKALGAPDDISASYFEKDAVATYDMGEGEEGDGDLILYMEILNFGAAVRVEFFNNEFLKFDERYYTFNIGDSAVTINYTETEPYRYVKITSIEEETWKLDAIETTHLARVAEDEPGSEEPASEEPTSEETEPEEEIPPQGLLVKLADDGDETTTVDAAVYIIGADGKRHAFPNAAVFNSWNLSFDEIATIDPTNLAGYELGGNVTIRPGTYLVKITTDPKVYAVEPGGVLRWVSTEEIAIELYGEDWAQRVVDVADVFFANYEKGDDIETAIHPTGTLGVTPLGEVVYLQNGSYYGTGGVFSGYMRFNGDFATDIADETFEMYIDAGDLGEVPEIAWPY